MKNLAVFVAVLISVLISNNVAAQRCGSMEVLHQQMLDPTIAANRQQIEEHTNQFIANYQGNTSRAVITIPVVVHVVYNTTAQNVSNAQIQAQIDRLNLDYRKLNTDASQIPSVWQSIAADYEIEFCLASRDPNGNATTGIIRKQTSVSSFSTNDNVKRTANGGDDAWPASSYLNLWVCNLSGGVLGYAQFPGGNAATDGVVIGYTCFGTGGTAQAPFNLGRTATHEVGHWLNLYHIWGDDGTGCNGSDQVGDTPNQGNENYGCPTFPAVSCSNGPNGDMFMNYMDYTNDACMYMFTNGQKTRSLSLFANGGSRASLLSSQGCQSITTPPIANFTADVTQSCTGLIRFTDLSTNAPTSWLWNFGDGITSAQQNPTHLFPANGTYTVTLTVTNNFGNNSKTITNYITVNKPAAPAATDASRCGAGTFTLTTTSTNPVAWLDSAGNVLSSSTTFTTPVLNQTTTYWLQDTVGAAVYNLGKPDNSGSGGYLTQQGSNWATVFNVNTACVLQSVYIYAGSTATRTIELRNSAGTLLQSRTVSIPSGGSRVTLNFNLPVGTGYRLQPSSNSTLNLYRNNAGATYPYTDAGGYVSITGNNAANVPTYYYYFYDWIIQGTGCVSQRKAVTATISSGLSTSTSVNNASCGSNNGSASVSVQGGTPTYTYNWSNGSTSSSISNVAPATYTVTVSDANACSGTATAVVAGASSLQSTQTSTNATCNGTANGSASVTVTSGDQPFSYSWNTQATGNAITNLAAGDYFVTITDANNCIQVDSFTITEPAAINVQVTANNANCYGQNNGTASANASGGNGGYNYVWFDNTTGSIKNNLAVGNYAVTVTDANGCSATGQFSVEQPDSISLYTNQTSVSCFGLTDASANVIPSGGIGAFTYLWSNGITSQNTQNLGAGNYAVTVTDENGCTASKSITIQQPSQLVITTSTTNGTAMVDTVTGGEAPYTYLWSTGATAQQITGLSTGNYLVTITDNNGCTAASGVNVVESGIENTGSSAGFRLWPNPAKNELQITVSGTSQATLDIRNILGQVILSTNITTQQSKIDVSQLVNGIYIAEVKQAGRKQVKQFVIAH